MTRQENLLEQVQMYDFALVETAEYLDGHPQDAAALAYFQEMQEKYAQAKAEYERQFGPLSWKTGQVNDEWTWVNDPWPWEGADN